MFERSNDGERVKEIIHGLEQLVAVKLFFLWYVLMK